MKRELTEHTNRLKSSYTPGPWKIGYYKTTVVSEHKVETTLKYNSNENNDGGANDTDYYGGNLIGESILREENARLIAAAPDMFQTLVELTLIKNEDQLKELLKKANNILDSLDFK